METPAELPGRPTSSVLCPPVLKAEAARCGFASGLLLLAPGLPSIHPESERFGLKLWEAPR